MPRLKMATMGVLHSINEKFQFLKEGTAKKGLWRTVNETFFEYRNRKKFQRLGVSHPDFVVNLDSTNVKSANKDAHENQPSSFYSLAKAFKKLDIKMSEMNLLDIGCGSGRVLSFGMLRGAKIVFGVDLDEPALKIARENCNKMAEQGFKTDFRIDYADATSYKIPDNINVVYMFNPFGVKTMQKVATNLFEYARKKELYVVYSNPTCREIFDGKSRVNRIYESYYKSKNPEIFIYKISG